jgi:integrase
MSKDIFAGKQLNDLKCYIRYDKAYSEAKEYDLLFLFKKIKVWELLSNTKIKQWEKEDLIEYFTHGIKVKPEHYREFKEVINAENLDYLALGLDENISKFTLQRKVQFLNEITTNIFHREDLKLNVKDIEIDIKVKMDTIYNKEEIIDICNSLANIQDRFIIYAMFNCVRGNESSDLLQIKEQDVDLENKWTIIWKA